MPVSMKRIFLLITFISITSSLLAAEIVDGYLISLSNDTVRCKIKVPKGFDLFHSFTDLFVKVSIMDSAGKTQTYKAKNQDINGFGFILDSNRYDYALKRTDDYGAASFLLIKETGKKLNLYYSYYYVSVNGGASYRTDVYLLLTRKKSGNFSKRARNCCPYSKEKSAASVTYLTLYGKQISYCKKACCPLHGLPVQAPVMPPIFPHPKTPMIQSCCY